LDRDNKRELFGEGPWIEEEDRFQWEHLGFPCLFLRHHEMGNLNGYIGVPPGHPWYEVGYDDIEASVHGGLTYAGRHIDPSNGEDAIGISGREDLWWVGFDTAHYLDLIPMRCGPHWQAMMAGLPRGPEDGIYRNFQYVMDEVERLAEQAYAAAAPVN
jgi:hypothetical protein